MEQADQVSMDSPCNGAALKNDKFHMRENF